MRASVAHSVLLFTLACTPLREGDDDRRGPESLRALAEEHCANFQVRLRALAAELDAIRQKHAQRPPLAKVVHLRTSDHLASEARFCIRSRKLPRAERHRLLERVRELQRAISAEISTAGEDGEGVAALYDRIWELGALLREVTEQHPVKDR